MSQRERGRSEKNAGSARLEPIYEGPEVLTALLFKAGSRKNANEAFERFREAQASGEERSDAIPTLFEVEPTFEAPEEARRLYANLFGLWARVKAGQRAETGPAPIVVPAVAEEAELPELPSRGSATGRLLDPDLVEAVWQHLADLSERELRRLRDRFMNAQPDLGAWLDVIPLPVQGGLAAADLAFEAWAMFDQAFGDRLEPAGWQDLRALENEPPPLMASQPSFAAYVEEQLDIVEDEEPGFGPTERAQVERAVAAAVAALGAAVGE